MSQPGLVNGEFANNRFGGGATETVLGTGVLLLMVILIGLILSLRRRAIIAPLLFGLILLPFGQTLVVGGVHLYVFRILILVGILRALASRSAKLPLFGGGYNNLDRLFVTWAVVKALAFILRFGDAGAVVNQAGFFWDTLGAYFLLRFLIQNDEDCVRAIRVLAAVTIVLGITVGFEKLRGMNLYGLLTAAPIIPEVRQGSVRARGPFHHAILAGTFGATLLPLFYWLWKSKVSRGMGLLGMIASTVIVGSSASSTPVSAYMAAIFGIFMWPFRGSMRLVRWAIVAGIVMLNFAMNAPVWWILDHVDLAGGSAGSHRAELIDNFVNHFGDWWLIGTSDNAKWGYEMWDISNQYVAEGEVGGLATFVCFLAILYVCFKWVGMSRRVTARQSRNEWYFWLIGATLFAHVMAFFGISYFDQTRVSWYALLALISSASAPLLRSRQRSPHPAADAASEPDELSERRPMVPAPSLRAPGVTSWRSGFSEIPA
jgi:hypothetical protein